MAHAEGDALCAQPFHAPDAGERAWLVALLIAAARQWRRRRPRRRTSRRATPGSSWPASSRPGHAHERRDAGSLPPRPPPAGARSAAGRARRAAIDRRAWLEDSVQVYQRWRVPIQFASGALDLRIVLDAAGLVAGFFQAPHQARSQDGQAAAAEASSSQVLARAGRPLEGEMEVFGSSLAVKVDLAWRAGPGRVHRHSRAGRHRPAPAVHRLEAPRRLHHPRRAQRAHLRRHDRGGRAGGDFLLGGERFRFRLTRERTRGPPGPGAPASFSYRSEEARFQAPAGELGGTLTLPEGAGPFPPRLLLTAARPGPR